MQNKLFRKQALTHQQDNIHGDVLVIPSLSHFFIIIFILIWLSVVLIWLFNSHFARKETVNGWLEPSSGLVKIFTQANRGLIKQILVKEGQSVIKGQPLIIINGDSILANGENLEEKLLAEYKTQQHLFEQQLLRSKVIFNMRRVDIAQQISASKTDLALLESQLLIINERYELAIKKFKNYEKIQLSGYISVDESNKIFEQKLMMSSERESLKRSKISQQNKIQQLQASLQLLPQEHKNSIDKLKTNLSDVSLRITQLHGQQAHTIKAPRSGTVSSLQVKLGQQPRGNTPMLTIVPEGADIIVNLLVPVKAAGFVEVGQPIDIRYHAFPYQKFGLYSGEILSISDAIILPKELPNASVTMQEPAYLVKAKLDSATVTAFGRKMALKSGMTLSADIKLDSRTLLQWLFEPILSLQGRL